jgi:serine/threonine protein kinase
MALLRLGQVVTSYATGYRYRIDERLSFGAYGETYRAWRVDRTNRRRGPDVCIKVTEDAASWHREAYFGELLAGNTRVIAVHESWPRPLGTAEAKRMTYCTVFEMAEHGSLSDYLERTLRPWPERRVRREILGLLRAIDQLHQGGALHRDITPFNVLVCAGGVLKLADFGIARHTTDGRGLYADTFNPWFAATGLVNGDHKRWILADDVWQIGQLMAYLVRGDASERVSLRDVDTLPCSEALKRVIRRAIGPRGRRHTDAREIAAVIEHLPPLSARPRSAPRAGERRRGTRPYHAPVTAPRSRRRRR